MCSCRFRSSCRTQVLARSEGVLQFYDGSCLRDLDVLETCQMKQKVRGPQNVGRRGLAMIIPLLVASEITTQILVQLGADVAEWIVLPQRVTLDVFLYSNLTSLLLATRGSGNNHVEHPSLVPVGIQTSDSLDRSYIEITKKKTRRHAVIKRASQSLDQPTAQTAPTKVFTHSPTHDANTFTSPPLYINPISTLNESSVRRPRFIRAPCLGPTDQRRSWDCACVFDGSNSPRVG